MTTVFTACVLHTIERKHLLIATVVCRKIPNIRTYLVIKKKKLQRNRSYWELLTRLD